MRRATIALLAVFLLGFAFKFATTPYVFRKLNFFPEMPVAVTNPVTVEGALLGRHLFYDTALSIDSTMSCGSCHKQEFAFSDGPKKFSEGRNSVLLKRNTMPLFNLAWYPSLFWDGKAGTIEEQVFHPVKAPNEMNLPWVDAEKRLGKSKFYRKLFSAAFGDDKIDSTRVAKAIGQFLRTLISNQSHYDRVLAGTEKFNKMELEGFVLINDQTKGDCLHCHSTDGNALGTRLFFSNNGLDSVAGTNYPDQGRGAVTHNKNDNGKFITPTLRNIALTAPYMHDGRFNTLEEVIEFYSTGVKLSQNIDSKMQHAHRGGVNLSKSEQQSIVAFLKSMTDSVFIQDSEFSNPFLK